MATITLATVDKTLFGNVAGNTGMYTGANVDSLFTDLIAKVEAKLTSAMHYKGSVANEAALPADAEVGDVYNVSDTGKNVAWDGKAWDELSGIIDLSAYETQTQAEAKYLQIANTDAKVTELGYLKEAGVQTLINTALKDYTKSTDLGDLALKDNVAKADLSDALAAELDAKATTEALNTAISGEVTARDTAIATAVANYTKTADLDAKITDLGYIKSGDVADTKTKVDNIGKVTMPTKDTVTLYELYDAVNSIVAAAK